MAMVGPALAVHAQAFPAPRALSAGVAKVAATAVAITPASPAALKPLSSSTAVYITKTGSKYHRANCRYLRYSKRKVTLKWAKSHGYTACKVCRPPKK
jgi:hypothetical protein